MKKVYFGDRYIVIASEPSDTLLNYNYGGVTGDLWDFVEEFVSTETMPDACICLGDEETIWKDFSGLFRNIDAAGGLIKNGNNEYLVIDRRGYIDLPKGKKEQGETNEQNALREVNEETGVENVRITSHLVDTYHTYLIGEERVLKCTHWYNMEVDGSPALIPQTEEDIVVAKWVSKEELKQLSSKTYASLRDVFNNAVEE
ncbi:MAG: NUDIX domain-containing protein [Bacteroidales bacterium]|nr:NUDIX domain-containing protein [Bacteroidales bacterium]